MKIRKWTSRTVAIALMAILVGFMTGCGGGGGGNDESDTVEEVVVDENAGGEVVVDEEEGSEVVVDEDDGSEAKINDYAGVWLIKKEDTTSYWIFNEDGTFEKKRAGEGLDDANHFVGTYTVSGGQLQGEFTNPGVGTGAIEGVLTTDDKLLMDFIEYWHTPPKVVPCTGVRQ